MAWQKSDPKLVAERVSEVRVRLVVLLDEAGSDPQSTADLINQHFNEMVVLTECMGDWPPRVVARAMLQRLLDYGEDDEEVSDEQ